MKKYILVLTSISPLIASLTGCGTAPASQTEQVAAKANVNADQFKLAEEPDGAIGVIEARESAQDGTPLVLVGRVGGSTNPWIDGRAAFTLLDASMTVVAEGEAAGEGEICTGDCCATERLACTTLVKVVDDAGKIIPVDSRELFGLQESDMVVVQGTAKKDKEGNFTMLAKGVYVRR